MKIFLKNNLIFIIIILLLILSALTINAFKKNTPITSGIELPQPETEVSTTTIPKLPQLFQYIEIIDSCGSDFDGICVNMRSGPNIEYPVITKLRNGIILKVAEKIENNGEWWYKILVDEWLHYPERVTTDWYVSAKYATPFFDEGNSETKINAISSSTKLIIIKRSEQMIYAYDNNTLFMKELISTGIELTPTPRGIFTVYKKTPSRYMQGPLPNISDKFYDLPGVPWNLYFTAEGAVIHGAYWHNNFGQPWSNGCVNLEPQKAKKLYEWANTGTKVIVQD